MVIEKYDTLVATIAYEYHRKYKMVPCDDIRQQLWLWFLEHPRKITKWETLDPKESTKLFARSLRNAAKDFCQKEKAQHAGYRPEDNYYYDKVFLELVLPSVFSGEQMSVADDDINYSYNKKIASEGGNWIVITSDINKALAKLTEEQLSILTARYGNGTDITAMALSHGITPDAMRMRLNRAINSLQSRLGGFRPTRERDYTHDEETETSTLESGDAES